MNDPSFIVQHYNILVAHNVNISENNKNVNCPFCTEESLVEASKGPLGRSILCNTFQVIIDGHDNDKYTKAIYKPSHMQIFA
jgi:hypothetical protein